MTAIAEGTRGHVELTANTSIIAVGGNDALDEASSRDRMEAACAAITSPPSDLRGRGIVVPGGGEKYFVCAWVCIRMLRDLGCELPIELWHLGAGEMSAEMRALMEPLGVRVIDAFRVRQERPIRRLHGWELKAYAIVNSAFEEVIFLDADVVPVADPAFLFESAPYCQHGAIFWPDIDRFPPDDPIWGLTGIAYRNIPQTESGQMVIHKTRCWRPLSLALWMNEHSDFWYRYIYGDKDTFTLSWLKLGVEYATPGQGIEKSGPMNVHYDFSGQRLFQHRNYAKWTIYGENGRVPGFVHEEACLKHLAELRERWRGRPPHLYSHDQADAQTRQVAEHLCGHQWEFWRNGHVDRVMTFRIDGRVDEGATSDETTWTLRRNPNDTILLFHGDYGISGLMAADDQRNWRGRWRMGRESARLVKLATRPG